MENQVQGLPEILQDLTGIIIFARILSHCRVRKSNGVESRRSSAGATLRCTVDGRVTSVVELGEELGFFLL